MYVGYVCSITDKGFAFVFSPEVNKRFFHLKTAWKSLEPPVLGDEVEFELAPGNRPNLPEQAVNVRPTGRRVKVRVPRSTTQIEVKTTIDGVTTTSTFGGKP